MQAAQENPIVRALRVMLEGSRNPLHDGVGFNRFHRPVAEECLKKIEGRGLDPTMARMLVDRVLPHYRGQLAGLGFDFDLLEKSVPTAAPKAPGASTVLGIVGAPAKPKLKTFEFGRKTDEEGDWLTIRFPVRDQPAVDAVKTVSPEFRRYDPAAYTWRVRPAVGVALAPKLQALGYEVSALAGAGAAEMAAKVTEVEGEFARAVMARYEAMKARGEIDWTFYDHQKVGIAWMMARDGALNCDDMGLGKTLQTIVALHERQDMAGAKFLVVVPATLKVNWVREIRRIDRTGKVLVVDSRKTFGRRVFAADPNVEVTDGDPGAPEIGGGHRWTIINYDILDRHIATLVDHRWGAVVCDEAHYLMSETSQRTRYAYRLCGFRTNWEEKIYEEVEVTDKKTGLKKVVKRQAIDPETGKKAVRKWTEPGHPLPPKVRYLLTGTPLTSRPRDLFPLLKIVRHPLGKSFWEYAQAYCGATHTGYGWDFTGCTFERLPELVKKVSTQLLQRFKDDCVDLPGKDRDWVDLDKEEELARYRELEELLRREAARQRDIRRFAKAVEEYEERHKDDESERLPTLAELKRAYRDAGSLTIDLISRMRHELALAKIPDTTALVETILEGREKVVVFTNYTKVREALCKKFGDKAVTIHGGVTGEKRQDAVDRFQNDPNVRVMVANLRAGGVGITLTAGTQVVMNDLDWTPANHLQGEDRCYRIGQKAKVTVHYMVVLGTIDEHVAEIYKTKLKIIRALEGGNRKEAAVATRAIEKLLAAA